MQHSLLKLDRLEVIVKTAERCNIACTYCYYFFHGDDSYSKRPPIVRDETIASLATFLRRGCEELSIAHMHIVFHGGEPMLQKPRRFDAMCSLLERTLGSVTNLILKIQTNGTLINDEWLAVLHAHNVQIGISMDGPAELHDRFRVDHKSRGTYDRTVTGLRRAQEHSARTGMRPPSLLSVINAEYDYHMIVRHFANDLEVRELNFLLPDCSHDSGIPSGLTASDYGSKLCQIFEAWNDIPGIWIREIDETLRFFQVFKLTEGVQRKPGWSQIVVVQSDGTLSIDDSLIPTLQWRRDAATLHIDSASLTEFLHLPALQQVRTAHMTVPDECADCLWQPVCKSGHVENRYSTQHGFNNRSIFCGALADFYSHVTRYLIRNGYPKERLLDKLVRSPEVMAQG